MYERAGTHKAIAMRPDDDLRLAASIKAAGGKADVLYGKGEIEVEWYASVKEFINGLMKNIFSGFKYNVFLAAGGYPCLSDTSFKAFRIFFPLSFINFAIPFPLTLLEKSSSDLYLPERKPLANEE